MEYPPEVTTITETTEETTYEYTMQSPHAYTHGNVLGKDFDESVSITLGALIIIHLIIYIIRKCRKNVNKIKQPNFLDTYLLVSTMIYSFFTIILLWDYFQ